jgi:GDP-mannose 6-dehydrogenase
MELDIRAVGVLGLSFKAGTDDLRESPLVELVERLLGKGCRIRIYDSNVSLARLRGRNRAYIEQHLPHISDLLVGEADLEAASPIANRSALQAVIEASELIIIGAGSQEYAEALKENPEDKVVVDLVRLWKDTDDIPPFAAYHGICW